MAMHIEPDVPDISVPHAHVLPGARDASSATTVLPDEFANVLDGLTSSLQGASNAEDAFAHGAGSLQDAVYERARADIALSVATATVGRIVQSIQTLLNMQV